jgi:hypothetical protein
MKYAVLVFLFLSSLAWGETNTVSSTVTIDKTPPSAISPSVNINQSDLCVVPIAGSIQSTVIGISTGTSYESESCLVLKHSKLLGSLGLKVASVSIIAQNDARVWDSLFLAGTYPPINGKIGLEAKEEWLKPENAHLIPEGSKIFPKTENKPIQKTKEGEWDDLKDFGLIALSMLFFL